MASAKKVNLKASIIYDGVIYAPGEHVLPPEVFAATRTKEGIGYAFDEPPDALPAIEEASESVAEVATQPEPTQAVRAPMPPIDTELGSPVAPRPTTPPKGPKPKPPTKRKRPDA